MSAILELEATMTSKGQITVPAALRTKLGLIEGSKVKFIYDGKQTRLEAELPVSAYRGILRHLGNIDTTIPKEPDRF
ncbi:MAG: AbrB/MazE/SpoVT family DNA-binding domain-containing protein [Polaromonas sp.]|uniref:AbrB/MazE/SpoVT family DNA-binding domain-containing protein n=1 Tax=Polaromonas sp. TaxID=1869339 RepID=UPI0027339D78|nr:AbrB/MazE/SpoVT family DNA-binding domain-containing protein [Polaromonas sp.]MDP2819722.1 AbrB/MazE/SpoVT family DNA-binding domain-containing protein [Polaromonas sp.]